MFFQFIFLSHAYKCSSTSFLCIIKLQYAYECMSVYICVWLHVCVKRTISNTYIWVRILFYRHNGSILNIKYNREFTFANACSLIHQTHYIQLYFVVRFKKQKKKKQKLSRLFLLLIFEAIKLFSYYCYWLLVLLLSLLYLDLA